MGEPEEKACRNETQNGCPPIPHRANGEKVVICGISEGANKQDLRQQGSTLTQDRDSSSFDPIYQGIIKCPKDSNNFYTKVAISMVALLTLYEDCTQPDKDYSAYPRLKRSHSVNF